jgi:hypothetical protein
VQSRLASHLQNLANGADDELSAPFTQAAGILRSLSTHGEAPLVDRGVSGCAAQYHAPTCTDVGGGGRDRNATGVREGCNPRCEISGVRNLLGFAYDANLNR